LRLGGRLLVAFCVVAALRRRSKTTSTTASTMGTSSSGSFGLRVRFGRRECVLFRFTLPLYQAAPAAREANLVVRRRGTVLRWRVVREFARSLLHRSYLLPCFA
jgi:hypothetical protein